MAIALSSTQRFDDTRLMALLCRHDIALYVANMCTAGKKQFYAFALVAALSRVGAEWWTGGEFSSHNELSKATDCPASRKPKELVQLEHILSMTRTAQSLQIHLKEMVDELGELATDSSTVVVEDELRAKIEAMRSSIKRIESNIKKKTEELHLSDRMSHKELDHLKTDKWVNLQLNIHVVRDQILIKLRAWKFELAGLDRADTGRELDHRRKEHVEKAMKSRVSGVQGALKRYEEIRREMMKLQGKGLDVDEDIWQVPHHEDLANFPDGEELERCKAEFSNLHTWFMTQYAEVKFFALLELHHLHDLVEAWQRHSSAMLGSDGQIGWMNLPERPPPLCYGRIQILCGPVSPVANSLTGEAVDGVSDAASSDDDENGELEDAPVPQDIAFLAALDALEELVGDDA
ncbi:hypothetical protein BS47DRAFT_1391578 [Hydnum rufescens UP504]|uniref:Uncharacterized protein n=1 Tax=Hydnum rufescens UP504 TaxID=1448309 RepID=A0A9P6DY81_9AGAM|nr:hypothetical protein BS47DRAFT_1391578 [Hydnum rufescens UP504]